MNEDEYAADNGTGFAGDVLTAFGKKTEQESGFVKAPSGDLPLAPSALDKTGLSPSFLLELVMKVVHYVETPTAEHVARVVGLPTNIVNELIGTLKKDRMCEIVSGSAYDLEANYRLRLTEKGMARAEEALERCRYAGCAPVTIDDYDRVMSAQSTGRWQPPLDAIRETLSTLVLDAEVMDLLERALHSGRSSMVFGPSGNGKTHILSQFVRNLSGEMIIPYSIYAYGQIIRVFDPFVHKRIDGNSGRDPSFQAGSASASAPQRTNGHDDSGDRRWVRIRRPGLVVGGEVSEDSLELGYDSVARFYQAPKHLKTQGGVLVVDDFGRQRVSPTELLNRWIMALERGRDNLQLRTGESIEVPFNVTLLFSTNLNPNELADAAFLRRIPYKVYIPTANQQQFAEIMRRACAETGVQHTTEELKAVAAFLDEATGKKLSGSLARDLASLVADDAIHEGKEPVLLVPVIKMAWRLYTGEVAPLPESAGNGAA